MEGYLKKWINIVTRWQDRYFILNDHILHYCEHQGGQSKGQIHLKVAAIILVPEDPLKIIINTGTNQIQVKASSVPEKIEWVNALKRAQESCQETIPRDCIKDVNDILTDIWVTQAAFDQTLNVLVQMRNLFIYIFILISLIFQFKIHFLIPYEKFNYIYSTQIGKTTQIHRIG